MKGSKLSSLYLLSALASCTSTFAQEKGPIPQWPLQSFKTTPHRAPFLNVTKSGQTEPGYLLFAATDDARNRSTTAYIYSDDGQTVWYEPTMTLFATRQQTLNGEPVITSWSGFPLRGYGYGAIAILNSSYDQVAQVGLLDTPENHFETGLGQDFSSYVDFHEDEITDDGTILVTAHNVTQADLSSVGGAEDGWVMDALFYEIDIETNEVLFRWSAIEHLDGLPLSDAEVPIEEEEEGLDPSAPWAYAHINSIVKYDDTYLVSSRHTCSILLLDKDGSVIWKLHVSPLLPYIYIYTPSANSRPQGQNGGDFTHNPSTKFCYQHAARIEKQTADKVTLHLHNNDNRRGKSATKQTTGLLLDLDLTTKTVTLNRELYDPEDPIFAMSQGNYQALANGHVLLSHGSTARIREYDAHGAPVMSATFGYTDSMAAYRVYRAPWVGTPSTKPAVVACPEDGGTAVYVSWNGATDVESWTVSTGPDVGALAEATTVLRNGFETRILIAGEFATVVVEAVGGPNDGGQSDAVTVGDDC